MTIDEEMDKSTDVFTNLGMDAHLTYVSSTSAPVFSFPIKTAG